MSNDLNFSPFSGGYPDQATHMASANLDPNINFFWGIYDFNDPEKNGHNFQVQNTPLEPWWPLGGGEQICLQTKINHAPLPSTLDKDSSSPHDHSLTNNVPTKQTFQSFDIRNTSQQDAQLTLQNELEKLSIHDNIPSTLPSPIPSHHSWHAVRLGIRYSPMILAIQYKNSKEDTDLIQKDLLIENILKKDDTPDSLLTRLSSTYSDFLDFDKKLSKRQVLRLLGMLIDHSRNSTSNTLPPQPPVADVK
eukprot:CAMPEP_0197319098 /NCGR_PEP_ID=MMETSP0891-20130614/53438_1 /TAXON_ID=44058 ORGANISM="Aureoumbra lagunensis, Strain CCMP1510" /NCGR_SAMPLE_ID=MMETSP0891 /ASSEMBLY_ACC=CAM_ASM_000534 /LENGTH=248 /DNA_ID=CAMNT_0042809863 /DNA_START=384 /DNA_END=1130 /DNA_ORIENTATION=+